MVAVSTPVATMVAKSVVPLTSHTTGTSSSGMPPPASGSGASRVHSTTLVGSGSPEATPSVNGSPDSSSGASVEVVVVGGTVVVAAVVGGRLVVGTVVAFDVAAC